MDEFGGAGDGGILLFAEGDDGLVVHRDHLAGVDHAHAMVAKTARRQCRVNGGLIADEVKGGDFFVRLKRQLGAGDDHAATMVTTHDIHCDSHR